MRSREGAFYNRDCIGFEKENPRGPKPDAGRHQHRVQRGQSPKKGPQVGGPQPALPRLPPSNDRSTIPDPAIALYPLKRSEDRFPKGKKLGGRLMGYQGPLGHGADRPRGIFTPRGLKKIFGGNFGEPLA
ncbi:MAG: hypothetical protein CM15mP103_05100 [Gammaproteobacteria bacterium]|nr:MAG: hypothetical protein CM15mP103_05100 [Gammaproteobacteria bacterium]